MASGPITSWPIDEQTMETVTDFIFLGSKITADGDCSHKIKTPLLLGRKAMTNLDRILKSRHYSVNKGLSSQSYGFPSSHVWMCVLNHKEGWAVKNWWLLKFWTVVFSKTRESPLDCKEIKSVNPKGNQPWTFIGRTDAEAPILWPPDAKSRLIRKDPDARKDWRKVEKGTTEDETVEWHHQLNGHEFEQALGDGEGQGRLGVLQSMGSQRVGQDWEPEQLRWVEEKSKQWGRQLWNYFRYIVELSKGERVFAGSQGAHYGKEEIQIHGGDSRNNLSTPKSKDTLTVAKCISRTWILGPNMICYNKKLGLFKKGLIPGLGREGTEWKVKWKSVWI